MTTLNEQKFGIEIEMTGITRETAARVIGNVLQTVPVHVRGSYDGWEIRDRFGRTWKIVSDGSIRTMIDTQKVELVSPILYLDKCEILKKIVVALEQAGAFVNSSCGIHVHIDAANHDVTSLKNLVKIFASREDVFEKVVDVYPERKHYCQATDQSFLNRLNQASTMDGLQRLWYNGQTSDATVHYSQTRYRMLNLHNVWYRGTVETRMFNATLELDKIMAYVEFCLGLSAMAINVGRDLVAPKKLKTKKEFDNFYKRCGLTGKKFQTTREVMTANLQ